jgi:uncharacterized protein (DUF362 family)
MDGFPDRSSIEQTLTVIQDRRPVTVPNVRALLPTGAFRRILVKPNWVKHQEHDAFPIEALVTSTDLIEAVVDACLECYPDVESITIGDVPLQSCDWARLHAQAGLDRLERKYGSREDVRIRILDLRKEKWRFDDGFMKLDSDVPGDPLGYVEVVLDEKSLLEEISRNARYFRVSDYDAQETTSAHRSGDHRYLIARTVLEADLVINLPKMKTHQKAGITGALKNLVGINGSKAFLVHHQRGFPARGGDEFPDDVPRLFYWQARLRELFQKRSALLFKAGKAGWEVVKRWRGIQTLGTRENLGGNFHVASGSWPGNDSIWRMVYDLNTILLFGRASGGPIAERPQRAVVSILDGVVSGEGNGPLQPLPVETDLLLASTNPFLVDLGMAKLMGFDWRRIRLLSEYRRFPHRAWRDFEPDGFRVVWNGQPRSGGVDAIETVRAFEPPPGWRRHIELDESMEKARAGS